MSSGAAERLDDETPLSEVDAEPAQWLAWMEEGARSRRSFGFSEYLGCRTIGEITHPNSDQPASDEPVPCAPLTLGLEGHRCRLERPDIRHVAQLHELARRDGARWLGRPAGSVASLADVEASVAVSSPDGDELDLLVVDRAEQVIGRLAFGSHNPRDAVGRLTACFVVETCGQYASCEALFVGIRFLFGTMSLRKLYLEVDTCDAARLPTAFFGLLTLEVTLVGHHWFGDRHWDTQLWAIDREGWLLAERDVGHLARLLHTGSEPE